MRSNDASRPGARSPGRLTSAVYRFRTEGDTPIRQAAAIGLGLLIGSTPFVGFHLLLTIGLGKLFRLNRFKTYLAANISNPLVAPFLYASEIQIGSYLRTGHVYSAALVDQIRLQGLAIDVLIGAAVVGPALGLAGFALTYLAVNRPGEDPALSRLIDRAAELFLPLGITPWEFARSKLRMDPVYLQVLRDGRLPREGRLLDLGCGQGLMLSLISAAQSAKTRADWPIGWPPPPAALALHGIELRPRVARRAQVALAGIADVQVLDLLTAGVPGCDVVLIFDVLHLLPHDAQERLLRDVYRALTPGGLLAVREADAGGGWRFRMVRVGNRINAILQGRGRRRFEFDRAEGWRVRLQAIGFTIEATEDSATAALGNFLVYARKRAT